MRSPMIKLSTGCQRASILTGAAELLELVAETEREVVADVVVVAVRVYDMRMVEGASCESVGACQQQT